MEKGFDSSDIMSAIHNFARYGVVVEIYSEWHSVVYRIMQKLSSNGASGLDAIIKFCIDLIEERGKKVKENQNAEDFLSLLYAMHDKDPDRFKINDNLNHTIPKVAARSDIASATLSATIYSSCKHSRVLGKLRQGLNERRGKGLLSDPITFKEAQECPYLQIVLKETLRMHSDVGLTFPRVVPEGVVTLAGRFFPGGVYPSTHPFVTNTKLYARPSLE